MLLYSAIAPVFDHHVAERRPEHGHLSPSGILLAHKHLDQDSKQVKTMLKHGSEVCNLVDTLEIIDKIGNYFQNQLSNVLSTDISLMNDDAILHEKKCWHYC